MDNSPGNSNNKQQTTEKGTREAKKKPSYNFKDSLKELKPLIGYLKFVIVSAIIISLFIIGFVIFTRTIEDNTENSWNVLWNYFNTDVFRTLLASIAIPLAVFFWKSYEKKRERQIELEEQKHKERLAKIIEEHKRQRIETIEQTFDQWNQINGLISEIRFVKLDKSEIRDVQFKIASQSITFGKVIYLWSSRFPILPSVASYLFVSYTNILYWSAWGIAYSLRNKVDLLQEEISQECDDKTDINKECREECRDLQEALGIFQRGIVSISFIHLSYILKYSDQLLEYIETYVEDEQMQNEFIDLIRTKIEKKFKEIFEKQEDKEKKIHEELERINTYRLDYLNYVNYYKNKEKKNKNDGNKTKKFVPVPISLHWNRFKESIKKDKIFKTIIEEMRQNADSTKKDMISEIEKKIKLTEKEIEKNIDKLIKELLYLKIYEYLLFIDKFRRGEIRYTSKNKNLSTNGKLRKSFQNINEKIRHDIPETFVYSQEDKNKIYDLIDNEIKWNSEYEKFIFLFRKEITDTNFMNIVADDVVEYIRFVGREIRFSHILSPEDDLAPVS